MIIKEEKEKKDLGVFNGNLHCLLSAGVITVCSGFRSATNSSNEHTIMLAFSLLHMSTHICLKLDSPMTFKSLLYFDIKISEILLKPTNH